MAFLQGTRAFPFPFTYLYFLCYFSIKTNPQKTFLSNTMSCWPRGRQAPQWGYGGGTHLSRPSGVCCASLQSLGSPSLGTAV